MALKMKHEIQQRNIFQFQSSLGSKMSFQTTIWLKGYELLWIQPPNDWCEPFMGVFKFIQIYEIQVRKRLVESVVIQIGDFR